MKVGTRSLLFGLHQFLLHPIFVELAWRRLYGRPSTREALAILLHDWGYWGIARMEGGEADEHPRWAARVMGWLCDWSAFLWCDKIILGDVHLLPSLSVLWSKARFSHWRMRREASLNVEIAFIRRRVVFHVGWMPGSGQFHRLSLYHSRFLAKQEGTEPSRLCWADKLGTAMMPWWLWLGLGKLTGELHHYITADRYEIHDRDDQHGKEFFLRYRGLVKQLLAEPRAGEDCNRFAATWRAQMAQDMIEIKA